ncbi:MAG: hypothetical protein WAK26_07710, partial [Terracidiphilus sp.]
YLRELVRAENTKPHLSSTPILAFLAHLVDGVKVLYEESGISLKPTVSDSCQPVFIDRARALQALSSVLLIAHRVSQAQDTVEVIATSPTFNSVQIVVQNLNSRSVALNAEARLDLALAEANIRCQHANFSWSPEPFCARIELACTPIIDSH